MKEPTVGVGEKNRKLLPALEHDLGALGEELGLAWSPLS